MKTKTTQNEKAAQGQNVRELIEKAQDLIVEGKDPNGAVLNLNEALAYLAQPEKSQRSNGYGVPINTPEPPQAQTQGFSAYEVKQTCKAYQSEIHKLQAELERVTAQRDEWHKSALNLRRKNEINEGTLRARTAQRDQLLAALKACLMCLTADSDSAEQYAVEIAQARAAVEGEK